ncbi:unnamed protein product [Trifolium pratense]|uniref:Uncharacterized protein n=1 Tax=Trifolium pratense TaxID=57577 RepID=A0ACB0LVX2_TRIPR|nr:unnamed protein product [Trifolium pratense]
MRSNFSRSVILHMALTSCALCKLSLGNTIHLMLYCSSASDIWYRVFRWSGVGLALVPWKIGKKPVLVLRVQLGSLNCMAR